MAAQKPLYPQLCMRRNLNNLDQIKLSAGYTLRSFNPGDVNAWNDIINTAFDRSNMDFNKLMRTDYAFRNERVLFVCYQGQPVATAAAWYKPEWGKNSGYLHMVGVLPEHSGKGLGLSVSLAAMQRMADEGREDVILQTDDFRIPALKTYLKLGFEPVPIHENQPERWKETFIEIGKPGLLEKFKMNFESPLFEKISRKNMDYEQRYPMAQRWNANRVHRLGTAQTDALGDESLYKASRLGSASVEPESLKAASEHSLKFSYVCGEESLSSGTKIQFYTDGQGTLFKNTRISKPCENSLKATCSGECTVKPFIFGFEIVQGILTPEDEVIISVDAFDWTPIANRYEVKVIIQKDKTEPTLRFPEPLIIDVEPLGVDRLQIMLPCTYKKGATVKATITARDIYDNRSPHSGEIFVIHNGIQHTSYMSYGFTHLDLNFNSGETESVKASFGDYVYESNPCVNSEVEELYIGDLHVHDFLSAAHGYSDRVYDWGRYDKSLDFVSVAVQNHGWTDNEKWAIAKHMNERYLEEGEFVTFLGCEWQHSGYGDKVVHFLSGDQPFFAAEDRKSDSVEKLYEAVMASDSFIVSHHTAYRQKLWCGGTDYDVINTDIERLIELWSMHGSSEGFDDASLPMRDTDNENTVMDALKKGMRLGFSAGSDTHSGHPGGSAKEPRPYWGGLTAVWAKEKTRRSIFEALYNRHTYALTGSRIVLKMTVNGALMGSEIKNTDKADVNVKVWAPKIIEKVQVIKNTKKLTEIGPASKSTEFDYSDNSMPGDFYHCRVILTDGSLAVCSPVWIV